MSYGGIAVLLSAPIAPPKWSESPESVALWVEYYKQYSTFRGDCASRVQGPDCGGVAGCLFALECVEAEPGLRCGNCIRKFAGEQKRIVEAVVGGSVDDGEEGKSGLQGDDVQGQSRDASGGMCASGGSSGSRDEFERECRVEHGGESVKQVGDDSVKCAVVGGGSNLLRNRANRQLQKERKKGRQMNSVDWRDRSGAPSDVGKPEHVGFWNSCSSSVRQKLIDSKAEMHIVQNELRAQEAKERIDGLRSPVAIMKKAVALADQAEKIAKKEGNAKVMGWAQTVATSEAESLARSAPSTVPSYDAVHKSVSEVLTVETPDLLLVSENVALKARLLSVEEALKEKKNRVSEENHQAVLKRVSELESMLKRKTVGSYAGSGYEDVVIDGMNETQIKDLRRQNRLLALEVSQARALKQQQQKAQEKPKSAWFS